MNFILIRFVNDLYLAIMKKKSLAETHPEIAKQWHPAKNGSLTPYDFTKGSHKKVWWKCDKGGDHEWTATVNNRAGGSNCPICRGLKVVNSNCLATVNPLLSKQWHPTKNGDLTPYDFTYGSGKKVWWKCPKGDDHEWKAIIANRSRRGDSCIFCSSSGTSKPEIRILCELRYLFDLDNVSWRSRIHGEEIDIFLQEYNIGIEYDGFHWHKKTKITTPECVVINEYVKARFCFLRLFGFFANTLHNACD